MLLVPCLLLAGGGSGGSIWIVCKDVQGHGSISVNGGSGYGQGGGGGAGRIAVQAQELGKFNITLSAHGGQYIYLSVQSFTPGLYTNP